MELRKKFGQKVDAFLQRFSLAATGSNFGFSEPFAINEVNARPLIDLGSCVYVPNEYRLLGSIYESPFYWMMADASYRDSTAAHRGEFLEKSTAHILRSVFGEEHVHENVIIWRSKKEIAGEADVLVVYGEFVIVVQAKSKRVTIKARAGNTAALKADFEAAIQHPYQQAHEFAELIQSGAECITKSGKILALPRVRRIFPLVTLSDPFPSVTLLSSFMLQHSEEIAPVIWDIGVLDCIAKILPTPIDLLFYLKCRSASYETIHSDSEYNFLGYHLEKKLAQSPEYNFMMIDRGFAGIVDDFMIASEAGASNVKRPTGILDRLQIPIISDLFRRLKTAPPDFSSILIDLYDFSSAALENLGAQIQKLRDDVSAGKEFKSFSIPTESGGITYFVARRNTAQHRDAAHAIGAKYKYDTKQDRWYVIFDSIENTEPVDALLPIVGVWREDVDLANNSARVSELFNSQQHQG